ncbi:MAG: TRAP transporter small permease [Thermovirgaceae bacterium]
MGIVRSLTRVTDMVTDASFRLAVAALAGLFALDVLRIIFRYFFSIPMNWVPGIVALLANWAVFLGVGVYLYRNEVIVIDYFYEKLVPIRARKYVDSFVDLLVVTFAILMIRYSWGVILSGDHKSSLSTIEISYYWYSLPMMLGMILALTGGFKRLFERFLPERTKQ